MPLPNITRENGKKRDESILQLLLRQDCATGRVKHLPSCLSKAKD